MENNIIKKLNNITSNFFSNTKATVPTYDYEVSGKKLLVADSPQELKTKKSEYQQQMFINKQQEKIVDSLDRKSLDFKANRIPWYYKYRIMLAYPVISQAIKILSEECTTIGDNGKMLNIYSKNKRLKDDLEILFYNRLDVNNTLKTWVHTMCAYGDCFLNLVPQIKQGIVNVRILPNIEIEREEKFNNDTGKNEIKFKWREAGLEFNTWQMAHFRLFDDSFTLPYGQSILYPVMTIFDMIRMTEDAMLVYRATRAPERRVVKVNVGNADPSDYKMLVQMAANNFKSSSMVNPQTGQINYKFNPASIEQDIFIITQSDNATNPIETLPGASNIDQISDLSHFMDLLFTGLGIPKFMLAYSGENGGDQKGNLAMMDVRFARKVNAIQQAIISELNKIAIIHLALLGYEDSDLDDFKLTLTNPSTQSDILKTEALEVKMRVYDALTKKDEKGIQAKSTTNAKREILKMSDDEIIQDLQYQYIETLVGQEMTDAITKIKTTGMFDKIINFYKNKLDDVNNSEEVPQGEGLPNEESGEQGGNQPPNEAEIENELGTLQENYIRKNFQITNTLEEMLTELNKKEK